MRTSRFSSRCVFIFRACHFLHLLPRKMLPICLQLSREAIGNLNHEQHRREAFLPWPSSLPTFSPFDATTPLSHHLGWTPRQAVRLLDTRAKGRASHVLRQLPHGADHEELVVDDHLGVGPLVGLHHLHAAAKDRHELERRHRNPVLRSGVLDIPRVLHPPVRRSAAARPRSPSLVSGMSPSLTPRRRHQHCPCLYNLHLVPPPGSCSMRTSRPTGPSPSTLPSTGYTTSGPWTPCASCSRRPLPRPSSTW